MTTLYQQIKIEQLEARKVKLRLHTNLLTTLLGEIQSSTIGTTASSSGDFNPTDSEVLKVITKFIKNSKESLKLKPDNTTVSLELKLLETFLPKQLTDDELKEVITDIVSKIHDNVQPNNRIGLVMKELKANYENRYDASKVKNLILAC